jgi:two-component system phosphate regulon sensor histidine kinase PhoR
MRRDFVANVSHELRTPVTSIQASAETLLDGGLEDREHSRRFVDLIHRNARRLASLVSDLLELSRIEERSDAEVKREAIDLSDVVDQVVATVRAQAAARSVALEADVAENARALGDPDGVERMVLNLVDNAIKYGSPRGRVRVVAASADGWVEISVTDDGPGIESRHLSRLFERFYRVDPGRSSADGGSGLGLAIVKNLAESMGGRVGVESEIGRGTTFSVRLPAAPI